VVDSIDGIRNFNLDFNEIVSSHTTRGGKRRRSRRKISEDPFRPNTSTSWLCPTTKKAALTHFSSKSFSRSCKMKFTVGITALFAVGASAFAPSKAFVHSSSLSSTTDATYTFTKSEAIFAEAQDVCNQ
jgi:hypothetical protein